jgi:N-carbamoyl-L-amino-acid hydrolase
VTFEGLWAELLPVGRSAASGGYHRQPFTAAEREAHAWFLEACTARRLSVESDALGAMTVGWWRPDPHRRANGVVTGSHLDSVVEGGAYDGPLGVVSALAAVDLLRQRGFVPLRPIGVAVFLEEEGSRFGLPCLGSRLVTGRVDRARLEALQDPQGVRFLDAAAAVGVTLAPDDALDRSAELRDEIGCFVELHVEQGRDLVDRGAAVGVGSGIWPHGRYRFDVTGRADHAGTTRMEDRQDPMLTWAMTVLAANKRARVSGQRATFGRVAVEPGSTNAIPSRVTGWLDARADSEAALAALVDEVTRQAADRAARDGTAVTMTAESVSPAVTFDPALSRAVADRLGCPVLPTAAGHDAGVLADAGIPTTMLFVRNPTGVSHSPAETASMADCIKGVEALADTLELLAGTPPATPRDVSPVSAGGPAR